MSVSIVVLSVVSVSLYGGPLLDLLGPPHHVLVLVHGEELAGLQRHNHLQGDPSGMFKPPVVIDLTVAYYSRLHKRPLL